jgi:glycerol uptake facilitator-like aquaporin
VRLHQRPGAFCAADHPRAGGPYAWLSEFAGSGGLLLVAVTMTQLTAPGAALAGVDRLPAGRALVIGLSVGAEVALFALTPLARCSGAHLNPAVSLLFWRQHALPARAFGGYVAAQVPGCLAGVGLARLLLGGAVAEPATRYGLLAPGAGVGVAETVAGEFLMTVTLLAVIVAMRRYPVLQPLGPLPAGVVVALMIWIGARFTGAGFNPIRNLAPAVFADHWSFQAVYLLAPLAASLCVAAVLRKPQMLAPTGSDFGGLPAAPLTITDHELASLAWRRCERWWRSDRTARTGSSYARSHVPSPVPAGRWCESRRSVSTAPSTRL